MLTSFTATPVLTQHRLQSKWLWVELCLCLNHAAKRNSRQQDAGSVHGLVLSPPILSGCGLPSLVPDCNYETSLLLTTSSFQHHKDRPREPWTAARLGRWKPPPWVAGRTWSILARRAHLMSEWVMRYKNPLPIKKGKCFHKITLSGMIILSN